jgi:hypothetical protein
MPETAPHEQTLNTTHITGRVRRVRQLNIILILVLVGTAVLFGSLYFHARAELGKSPTTNAVEEANTLIKKISEHMVMPNERPTIATVDNTKKLANQAFFKNARNGDKVLMYTQSKKAILYRPSDDKIIEIAYLNIKK